MLGFFVFRLIHSATFWSTTVTAGSRNMPIVHTNTHGIQQLLYSDRKQKQNQKVFCFK